MKKFLLTLAVFAVSLLQAQISFQKAISIPFVATTTPKSIVQCSDNGYLLGTCGNSGSDISCIIKTDDMGNVSWTKMLSCPIGSYNLLEAGEWAGGYYVLSAYSDTIPANSDFSVTKLDASGNITWSKNYPNTFTVFGTSRARPTSDGGLLISESLMARMGVLKIDANGNIMWHTGFTDDPNDQSVSCPVLNCNVNSDSSLIFAGMRNWDILLVKTDAGGQILWSSILSNQTYNYRANGVAETSDGGYIVCGYADVYPFAMKITAAGVMSWYHAYTESGGEGFIQIRELPNGNFLALGKGYQTTYVAMLDTNGNVLNALRFSSNVDAAMTFPVITCTSDSGYAITGIYTDPLIGMSALTLMKTDSTGNFTCDGNVFLLAITPQVPPAVLNNPIYAFPQTSTPANIMANMTVHNALETEFCLLFSTNDQSPANAYVPVYPSPVEAGENVHLVTPGTDGETIISVYDVNGRVVVMYNRAITVNGTIEIPTTGFAPGMYMVRITGRDGKPMGTSRFIVRQG